MLAKCNSSLWLTSSRVLLTTVLSALILTAPTALKAQALEEIVVTAQRRSESLQDVPISIDLYSAKDLRNDNFRNLEELSTFAPGVFVNESEDQGTDIFIRGFGTTGRNWANDSATPMFLDNVNMSRGTLGTVAFMDVQQLEILRGPQPIHFGLNATAGALSIRSARPTTEWEGYVNAEMGQSGDLSIFKRFGNKELEAAVGGPLADTLRFRVAGRYESSDGYLRDGITLEPYGYRADVAGRVSLEWAPTDSLTVFTKFEAMLQKWNDPFRACRRTGLGALPTREERRGTPTFDPDVEGDPPSLWLEWPQGSGSPWSHATLDTCNARYEYTGQSQILETPPLFIRTRDVNSGFLDIRNAADYFIKNVFGGDPYANPTAFGPDDFGFKGDGSGTEVNGIYGGQTQRPFNALIDVNYLIGDTVDVQWTTGFLNSLHKNAESNRNTPLLESFRHRVERFDQWSTEIRLSSFGGGMVNWMVGAFRQKENLNFPTVDPRAEVRRGMRFNNVGQDATWSSAFGNLTFNFMEDKASVDVGVRYTHVKKNPKVEAFGAQWVYDVTPCAGEHPDIWQGNTDDWSNLPVHQVTPADCVNGLHSRARRIDAEDTMFLLPNMPGRALNKDNLWYIDYGRSRNLPGPWRSPYATAAGATPFSTEFRDDENLNAEPNTWSHTDPQVVLRYRPNQAMSLYAKYATAYKAGGYDLGHGGSLPEDTDTLEFGPEFSRTFEFGASGTYNDRRGRYQATLFRVDFDDLIATTVTNPLSGDQTTDIVNIGEQRSQGFEFDTQWAFSDQLTLGLNFAYLDAEFLSFPNANCTEHEVRTIPDSGCELVGPTGDEVAIIDRAGQTPAYSPKLSAAGNINYWRPFQGYRLEFNTRLTGQSQYYTDFRGFSQDTVQDFDPNINLSIAIGDMDEVWRVALAGRNLLEPRPTFRPEFTSGISALGGGSLRSYQVKSVALQFTYNFFR